MILLNLDFFKEELTNNTLPYVKDEQKQVLLAEGETRGFNGQGFKSKSKLEEYLIEKTKIYDKELIEKITSKSRRTSAETVRKLHEFFKEETPLYIDRERLYKLMLLSSNLMFSPNEKICFTIMFEDPYSEWTVQTIMEVAQMEYQLNLIPSKIEESLNRYLVSKNHVGPLLLSFNKDSEKFYKIHFKNFIYYIRSFDNQQL